MKNRMKWAVAALVILVIAAGLARVLSVRKQQQEALAQKNEQKTESFVELAPNEVVQVESRELQQGVAVSGSLKAVNSAFVKVRVAGELQGLTVREGDSVKAGQIIARVESTEYKARLRQVQQQAQSAKAQVEIAQRAFDNNRSLVNQGFISATALESSSANLASAQANYLAAQAGADVASKSLDDTILKAPISGTISQRLVQAGERVGVDTKVLEIVDVSRLELEASVDAASAMKIHVGQAADLQFESAGGSVGAHLARINPTASTGSRAVAIYLAVDAAPGLRQGMFGQGVLRTQQTRTLTIPLSAVRTDKPSPYVQLIADNQTVHQQVELGVRGESAGQPMVAVTGLPEGASVVAGSVGLLRAGTKIKMPTGKP